VAKLLFDASGYLIGGKVAATEMNSTGHFMDDDDDDDGGSGGGGGGSGNDDDDKYSSPLYMTAFPYL
jgi:hypothetical protein